MSKTRTIPTTTCPLCGHARGHRLAAMLYRCAKCEAVHGTAYRGELWKHIKPTLVHYDGAADATRYFDVTILDGANAPRRSHGWFLPETGEVVQYG